MRGVRIAVGAVAAFPFGIINGATRVHGIIHELNAINVQLRIHASITSQSHCFLVLLLLLLIANTTGGSHIIILFLL